MGQTRPARRRGAHSHATRRGLRLHRFASGLRANLWLLPVLLVAASVGLAALLVWLEGALDPHSLWSWPLFFQVSPEGARTMLSSIATAMMTVAGVTFSITLLALSIAGQQYTPRLIRTFMKSRGTQVSLGVFVGTYAFCLTALHSVRTRPEDASVPSLAVTVGFFLALLAIGWVIYFIHHMASSIQVSQILYSLAEETRQAIRSLFPEELGEGVESEDEALEGALAGMRWHPVLAPKEGYIRGVWSEGLLGFAREHDVLVRMERGIGDFVMEGLPLAFLSVPPDEGAAKALARCYLIGRFRTIEQDPGYGMRQLVDVALKALSPAINDPTTALSCIDYLGGLLGIMARRRAEPRLRTDGGSLRVVARGDTFATLVDGIVDPILRAAEANGAIFRAALVMLERVAAVTPNPPRRRVLLREVERLRERALQQLGLASERHEVLGHADRLHRHLEGAA